MSGSSGHLRPDLGGRYGGFGRGLLSPFAVYLAGLAAQLWLWSRASYHWDQIHLYRLGMDLALDGQVSAVGKAMGGGGFVPGSLLQLVVGAPLRLWFDYRSPGLVVVLFHAVAGLILWRLFQRAHGPRFAAIFLAVYWLSPWRLYHSGFIWEPSYLLLPAAVHLWASWSQRLEAKRGVSVLLGLSILLAPQLHLSGVVLIVLTGLLWWRRVVRIDLVGLLTGAAVGGLTLLPTVTALLSGTVPSIAPSLVTGGGFVKVFPVFKALAYWVRLGSLDVGRRLRQVIYYTGNEPGPPGTAAEILLWTMGGLAFASTLLVIVATARYLQAAWRSRSGARTEEHFFQRYTVGSLVALLLAAGLTSQTLQGWHALIVLHAAAIPVTVWCSRTLEGKPRKLLAAAIFLFLILRLPVIGLLGLGHPMYRPPAEPVPLEEIRPDHIEDPRLRPAFLL